MLSDQVPVGAGIPHVCGGDPSRNQPYTDNGKVFPTYVGVIPRNQLAMVNDAGIPHVCGGDPKKGDKYYV